MTYQGQENLLSRWSRRKQQTGEETRQEDRVIELQQQDLSEHESVNTLKTEHAGDTDQQPVLTDEDMPPIKSLTEDSDYSGFMSSGVSDELRNLALRKLFTAPQFNIRDGLDEYDEDFTSFEKLGDIVTSDMKHQLEVEARKKLEEEASKPSDKEGGIEAKAFPEDIDPEHIDAVEEVEHILLPERDLDESEPLSSQENNKKDSNHSSINPVKVEQHKAVQENE